MGRAVTSKRVKPVVGGMLVLAAAAGALLAATPSSAERSATVRSVAAREARALTATAAAPRPHAQRTPSLFGGGARSTRAHVDEPLREPRRAQDEPTLEPWSLIAGALSVMIFIARRRRSS